MARKKVPALKWMTSVIVLSLCVACNSKSSHSTQDKKSGLPLVDSSSAVWDQATATTLPEKFIDDIVIQGGLRITSVLNESSHEKRYGLYNLQGKQLLPHVFERIDAFFSGRSIVKKNGKLGVIDQTGKELFYTDYVRIDRFRDNYAIVYKKQNNNESTIGMIDLNGREVVPAIYQWLDQPYNFSEGLLAVAQNFRYGFVDTGGKVVIPFKYVKVESFENGIAKVWEGWQHVGYINKNGEMVIPPEFDPMDQANLRRYYQYVIGLKDSALHVFGHSGKKVAVLNYQSIYLFNEKEKTFLVSGRNKWGTLDSNFRVRIPVEYQSLEMIFPNKVAAYKNAKIGFVDQNGRVLSPFRYDRLESCSGENVDYYRTGLARVWIKEKTGIVNSDLKLITPVIYDDILEFSHGFAIVKRNNKYGFINSRGKQVVAPVYDDASSFDGYTSEVTLKGETFDIDSLGKRIIEEDY